MCYQIYILCTLFNMHFPKISNWIKIWLQIHIYTIVQYLYTKSGQHIIWYYLYLLPSIRDLSLLYRRNYAHYIGVTQGVNISKAQFCYIHSLQTLNITKQYNFILLFANILIRRLFILEYTHKHQSFLTPCVLIYIHTCILHKVYRKIQ